MGRSTEMIKEDFKKVLMSKPELPMLGYVYVYLPVII